MVFNRGSTESYGFLSTGQWFRQYPEKYGIQKKIFCNNCYDTVLYDTVLYIVISYLLVCLFILRGINYYYSCSIYAATLYVECGLIYCMPACAPALRVPCKAVINRTTAKVPLARVV